MENLINHTVATMDGRRLSNSIIIGQTNDQYILITDYGNMVRQTAAELRVNFWPPISTCKSHKFYNHNPDAPIVIDQPQNLPEMMVVRTSVALWNQFCWMQPVTTDKVVVRELINLIQDMMQARLYRDAQVATSDK